MRVVLLAQKSLYSEIVIEAFEKAAGIEIVGMIYSDALWSGRSKWASARAVLQKGGWGIFSGKLLDMIIARPRRRRYAFPVTHAKDINAPDMLERIRAFRPDVIFSVFFNQILKDSLLQIPPKGAINIHPAYLPRYRGVGPTFWALANGEKELGVTFHFMQHGIDTGDILHRIKVPIDNADSVHSLYLRCARTAADHVAEVIGLLAASSVQRLTQDEDAASYFGMPDRNGFARLKANNRSFITWRDIRNVLTRGT